MARVLRKRNTSRAEQPVRSRVILQLLSDRLPVLQVWQISILMRSRSRHLREVFDGIDTLRRFFDMAGQQHVY